MVDLMVDWWYLRLAGSPLLRWLPYQHPCMVDNNLIYVSFALSSASELTASHQERDVGLPTRDTSYLFRRGDGFRLGSALPFGCIPRLRV